MAFKPESYPETYDEWLERTTKELARRDRMKAALKSHRLPKPKTRAKGRIASSRTVSPPEPRPQRSIASIEELRAAPGSVYARAADRLSAAAAPPPN